MNNFTSIGPEGLELKCWKQKDSREVQHALWAYLVLLWGENRITHSVLLKH